MTTANPSQPCRDKQHQPQKASRAAGFYQHVCPACGKAKYFTVRETN